MACSSGKGVIKTVYPFFWGEIGKRAEERKGRVSKGFIIMQWEEQHRLYVDGEMVGILYLMHNYKIYVLLLDQGEIILKSRVETYT